jgi:hypothetical protein
MFKLKLIQTMKYYLLMKWLELLTHTTTSNYSKWKTLIPNRSVSCDSFYTTCLEGQQKKGVCQWVRSRWVRVGDRCLMRGPGHGNGWYVVCGHMYMNWNKWRNCTELHSHKNTQMQLRIWVDGCRSVSAVLVMICCNFVIFHQWWHWVKYTWDLSIVFSQLPVNAHLCQQQLQFKKRKPFRTQNTIFKKRLQQN